MNDDKSTKEIINEKEQIVYFSQDVKEIVITIENHKFRIYEDMIKHFIDGTKLVEKKEISKVIFYDFANYVVALTNRWDDFSTIVINTEAKWSVVIKTKNNGIKRYAGVQSCPNNWEEFCKTFDAVFLNPPNMHIERKKEPYNNSENLNHENIISLEYNKNGITTILVNEILKFTMEIIEDFVLDRFWSDSARSFLGLLIVANLNSEKKINVKILLNQLADINVVRNIISNNIGELKKHSELQAFTDIAQVIDSDKPLKSVIKLCEDGLVKYLAKNNENNNNKVQNNVNEDSYAVERKIVIPKNISEISQETLANIYLYKMNIQEQEKINKLGIDKSVIENVKYINGIGYVAVSYISMMVNENNTRYDKNIYRMEMEPELDVEKARNKIYKYIKKNNKLVKEDSGVFHFILSIINKIKYRIFDNMYQYDILGKKISNLKYEIVLIIYPYIKDVQKYEFVTEDSLFYNLSLDEIIEMVNQYVTKEIDKKHINDNIKKMKKLEKKFDKKYGS